LNSIGIALSAEVDPVKLLEQILLGAKDITQADGGTSGKPIPFNSIPLHLPMVRPIERRSSPVLLWMG
jgi:hypothetical protein